MMTILIEVLGKFVYGASDPGEVKIDHLIDAFLWRMMLFNPKAVKKHFIVLCIIQVIISPEHIQEDALAKPAGTNKEKEMTRLLQLLNILALVYKIKVFPPQLLEVGNAVGYALKLTHN
jgi:hypothetical protein